MGIYDVPAAGLIEEVAKDLKAKFKQPAFAPYVKTGVNRERAPANPDWFFHRAASMLYRIYKNGALGTGALRSYYGGRKNRGVRPEHKVKASGKIIRLALQSLEKEGLVKKDKKGRKITAKGEKLLFEKAKVVDVVFRAANEKERAELAERLAKAELTKQKAAEARAAAEAARKAASELAKKEADKKAAQAAQIPAQNQQPGSSQGAARMQAAGQQGGAQKTERPRQEAKKDFAPVG